MSKRLRSRIRATSNLPSSSMYSFLWACGNNFPLNTWAKTDVRKIPASGPAERKKVGCSDYVYIMLCTLAE